MKEQEPNDDVLTALEEEGLSRKTIIRYLKDLLDADPTKVFYVDPEGRFGLRRKIAKKHTIGLLEVSKDKIKFVDKTKALELLFEVGKMRRNKPTNVNIDATKGIVGVVVPHTLNKAEAFKGLLPEANAPEEIIIDVEPSPTTGIKYMGSKSDDPFS